MKTNRLLMILSISVGVALSAAAFNTNAQQASGTMPGMTMSESTGGTASAATRAFQQNDANMMKNMSAPPYTGHPDADFVSHMIPHHQGAVDQAEVELKYGKDPAMRKLARNIIRTQNKEIAYMKAWQAEHDKK